MTREEAIEIIKRVDICANAAETARDMAIAALKEPEVVRCKDCKNRLEGTKMCAHPGAMGWDAIEVEDDDFCSYGERKDNAK